MQILLHPLRQHGRRVPRSQQAALGPGVLSSHHAQLAGGWPLLVIQFEIPVATAAPGRGQIWTLYDARLQAISDRSLRLIGFERAGQGDQAAGVVQEWLCEFVNPAPFPLPQPFAGSGTAGRERDVAGPAP